MDVERSAYPMMIGACEEIVTGLHVILFVHGGGRWNDCLVMPSAPRALSFSRWRYQLWMTVSLDTGCTYSISEERDLTAGIAGKL